MRSFALLAVFLLGFLSVLSAQHLQVKGRYIYTPCGDKVVLRGLNKMSIWQDIDGDPSMKEMAKTGANCVRIVWGATGFGRASGSAGSAQELDVIIENCIAQGMIPIPEAHDATGDGWKYMKQVVDWWVSPDVVRVLKKHEAYLIINIANEAGETVPDSAWLATYKEAIKRFRDAGVNAPLMIDADSWGQNIDKLQALGKELIEADPLKNIVFSVHMWWPSEWNGGVENTIKRVKNELQECVDMDLPIVVGEFARHGPGCVLEIPYGNIMAECEKHQIGWMAWSWGPGNGDCRDMDMTEDGTFETLRRGTWASEVVFGVFGLKKTSVKHPYITSRGVCPSLCEKPQIPKVVIACEDKVLINSNLDATGRSFEWTKNGVQLAGSDPTIELVDEGEYLLTVDSSGCVNQAQFKLLKKLPKMEVGGDLTLCTKSTGYLSIHTVPADLDFKWFLNGVKVGEGQELEISSGGAYMVKAEQKGCESQSVELEVDAPNFTTKDACVKFAGDVFLKARGGSGKFEWYSNERATNVLGKGKSIGVSVEKTTTFYVRDVGEEKYAGCKPRAVEVKVGKCK